MQHSIRLYENKADLNMTATIINIVEQDIKLVENDKSHVVSAVGVVLDRTIFHPQGGGQPADKGLINTIKVLTVKEDKSQLNEGGSPIIYHYLIKQDVVEQEIMIGKEVKLAVEAAFRKQCKRSHSAGHLIADILELDPKFTAFKNTALQGHHFPGFEYIKVDLGGDITDTEKFIYDINESIADYIIQDLPVVATSNVNGIRYVKMGELARMCGGTHVSSTKEIESCQVNKVRCSVKDGKRIATLFYSC
jgi:alanyl-tRNA synthetase